jgi:nucleotide-binding universal stress UspA family protein
MKATERILVATDNSDGAHRAVEAAAELAKQVGGSIIIVHVSNKAISTINWDRWTAAKASSTYSMRAHARFCGAPRSTSSGWAWHMSKR